MTTILGLPVVYGEVPSIGDVSFAPLLKPQPKGRKPRKPLKRSSSPIKRTSRPSRIRKSASGKEKESLNRLWSRVVMERYPVCRFRLLCPGAPAVDPAHVFGKGAYPKLRWVVQNGVGACRPCHDAFDRTIGAEGRLRWAENHLGRRMVDDLLRAHLFGPSPDRAETRKTLMAALAKAQGMRV